MIPLRLKCFSGPAVRVVAGKSRTSIWRLALAGKFPKPELGGGHRGLDVVRAIQEDRAERGLPRIDELEILEALEAAETALTEHTETAA